MADSPQLLGISVGDLATWIAAVGSIAAAWAARNAAKAAITIADQQRKDAKAARATMVRTIALAIGYELRRAAEEINDIQVLADQCASGSKGPGDLAQAFHPGVLQRTRAISSFDNQLVAFEGDDGAILASACAGVLNIKAQIATWVARIEAMTHYVWNEGQVRGLRMLAAEGRMVKERIAGAMPILEKHGGGKTHYEG